MHLRILPPFVLTLFVVACSSDNPADSATGGAPASTGGSSAASGGTSPGGANGSGGATATTGGMATTTAGAASGANNTGGSATTGGATNSSGGTVTSGGGSSAGSSGTTGGSPATGGTTSGGAPSTGGKSSTGGAPSTGGATSGGAPSTTGGKSSTGGGASAGAAGGPAVPPNAKADSSLIGFAAVPGFGLQTTTGGSGGAVVTVTTLADLAKYASAAEAYVIQVQGTITTPDAKYQKLRVTSNKTIIGMGTNATLEHIGFDVTGWWENEADTIAEFCEAPHKDKFTHVSNVIIRNLNFMNTSGSSSDADGVVVQCYSHHVWIDHNTFHGLQSGNDGAIDVKRAADFVTVSWNHIKAWDKSMLLGHVDSNEAQDRGTLHVTYHHNYLENTRQRHPRVRFAQAHIFNNYLFNDASVPNRTASYFIVAGVEANVHADGNLVKHSKQIYIIGEESDSGAKLTYPDSNKAVALTAGAEAVFQIQPNGAAFDPKTFYSYTLESADSLATSVPAGAGAGKI